MGKLQAIAKDTAIYGLSSIVGRFLNYLLVPLYTAQLSAASGGYGIITNIYAYVALILVLLTFGMETTYFRFTNKTHTDSETVYGTTLISVGSLSLLFAVLVLILLNPISQLMGYESHPEYIGVMAVTVAIDAFLCIPFAHLRQQKKALKFAALKLLNNDIAKAFSAHQPLEPESAYIKAILMMEDLSPRVFNGIKYREQRSFYRSEMAQELLKFSYLTTRKSPNTDMEHFAQFIKSVQDSDGWQEAHYKITQEFISESRMNCVLNNCILDLNIIRPQPQETMYQGYYQDDIERSHYMNLYLKKGRE